MSFAISDLDLDFNNVNNELPCELFDVINDTINETSVVCPEYVIGNHFTSNSQMSLADLDFSLLLEMEKHYRVILKIICPILK